MILILSTFLQEIRGRKWGWFKREVKSLADLKGLKMRIPGLGGEVMGKLGVTVQNIPGGEVFSSGQRSDRCGRMGRPL